MVDINPDDPNDVRSASALIVVRASEVNLKSENQDRHKGKETRLEGIMSHEIVHAVRITVRDHQDSKKNNIPYRQRANERLANLGSTVIAAEREFRGHVTWESPRIRWSIH